MYRVLLGFLFICVFGSSPLALAEQTDGQVLQVEAPAETELPVATGLADDSVQKTEAIQVEANVLEEQPVEATDEARFELSFDGKIRAQFSSFTAGRFLGIGSATPDRGNPFVGVSDGFALGDARLNLRGRYKNLYIRLGFDGALASFDSSQDPNGKFKTGLKDAYTRITLGRFARLSVGRFKPPFDGEQLTPTEDQYFVHRSLESRGVEPHEGASGELPGFAPGRQLGIMVESPRIIDGDGFTLGYAAALTNGNGNEERLNDNELPAVFARIFGGWGHYKSRVRDDEEGPATRAVINGVSAGLSLFANQITTGMPPNRQSDFIFGAGLDFAMRMSLIHAGGQFIFGRTEHLAVDRGSMETAYGGHLRLSVEIPGTGLLPGYRFAIYDPRRTDEPSGAPDNDRVMHHTIGLRYGPDDLPLVVLVDFTHSAEQAGRSINNDRFEAALQVTFE